MSEISILPVNEDQIQRDVESVGGTVLSRFDVTKLSVNPVDCDASLLPHLAVAFDVDITGLNEDESRKLLQNSREIKRYIGSKYAVRKAAEAIYGENIVVKPWNVYGGDPGKYKIHVTVSEEKPADETNLAKVKKAVEAANRASCKLDGFVIEMNLQSEAKHKITSITGGVMNVMPRVVEAIESTVIEKRLSATHAIEIVEIKPYEGA